MLNKVHLANNPGLRLKHIRTSSAKSPSQIASLVGLTLPCYYDLEDSNELMTNVSLQVIGMLANVLQTNPSNFFSNKDFRRTELITPKQLANKIQEHVEKKRVKIGEFERLIGYEIKDCLTKPDRILDWNVDCLASVCKELDINWVTALPIAKCPM